MHSATRLWFAPPRHYLCKHGQQFELSGVSGGTPFQNEERGLIGYYKLQMYILIIKGPLVLGRAPITAPSVTLVEAYQEECMQTGFTTVVP